jgi:hypothetical protein
MRTRPSRAPLPGAPGFSHLYPVLRPARLIGVVTAGRIPKISTVQVRISDRLAAVRRETCLGDLAPVPRRALMPRAFSSSAIALRLVAPAGDAAWLYERRWIYRSRRFGLIDVNRFTSGPRTQVSLSTRHSNNGSKNANALYCTRHLRDRVHNRHGSDRGT